MPHMYMTITHNVRQTPQYHIWAYDANESICVYDSFSPIYDILYAIRTSVELKLQFIQQDQ